MALVLNANKIKVRINPETIFKNEEKKEINLICDEKLKEIFIPICLSHQCFRIILQSVFNNFQLNNRTEKLKSNRAVYFNVNHLNGFKMVVVS